jgi:hypothetical protein
LQECSVDRCQVSHGLETLRSLPPTDAELAGLRAEKAQGDAERDRLALPARHLAFVEDNVRALDWTEAPAELRRQEAQQPALEGGLDAAREALRKARVSMDAAAAQVEAGRRAHDVERNAREVLDGQLGHERAALQATGCDDASDAALAAVLASLEARRVEVASLEVEERRLLQEVARAEEVHRARTVDVEARQDEHGQAEAEWRPARERWDALEAVAGEHGVLAAALGEAVSRPLSGRPSITLWQVAQEQKAVLVERLERAQDAQELSAASAGLAAPPRPRADRGSRRAVRGVGAPA